MLLVKAGALVLWLGSALWLSCDSAYWNPRDTRRISKAIHPVLKGRCYDIRTGITLEQRKVQKQFKHLCMRATCFGNYTMLVESCMKSSCVIPNMRYKRPYPDCCPEVLCKKGNRVRYLLTNETVTGMPTHRAKGPRRGAKGKRRKHAKKVCTPEEVESGAKGNRCGGGAGNNVTSTMDAAEQVLQEN